MTKKKPKYTEKQCITWIDSDGKRHRSRFFKPTSVFIIEKELALKIRNVSCYEVKVMGQSRWTKDFGSLNRKALPVRKHTDLSMVEPTYEMKYWRQKNKRNYQTSNVMCFV